MSALISGTTISLTRGDSLVLGINVFADGEEYTPEPGDTIRFALKQNLYSDEVLINKQVNMETMTISFVPSDTKDLSFGSYVYDVELTTGDGFVDTFIGPATFTITPEVY